MEYMDIEASLYPCVVNMLPRGVPEVQARRLVQELARAITSGNNEQASRVVSMYRAEMVRTPEQTQQWGKFEMFVKVLESFGSKEQVLKYLTVLNSVPQESTPFRHRRTASGYLTNATLQRHNSLMTPSRAVSVYAESFENVERLSERRSAVTSAYGGPVPKRPQQHDTPLAYLSNPYYSNMVPEADVLKYISYTLLATTSSLFPISNQVIEIPPNVPNGESGVFHSIFEAALLYQYLSNQVEKFKVASSLSPLKVNFLTVVSERLREYSRVVNQLSSSIASESVKSIYIQIYTQILVFRFYHGYLERFEQLRGDQLISEFDSLRQHGDPLVKNLAEEIFSTLIDLYMEYLLYWLVRGQLKSTHDEFFVSVNKSADPKLGMNFAILKESIPGFIPPAVAQQIYTVGKSYIYLETYLKEIEWASNFSNKYMNKFADLPKSAIGQPFYDLVNEQHAEITAFINDILKSKYYYDETVTVLKDILLMGRGDFIENIIINASDFLMEPVHQLQSYQLTKCLQESVQRSSLRNYLNKHDNNVIINKLDARLLESGHGSVGWDVFTLDYLVDLPLSIVLNVNRPGRKKEYLRIFNFLWRIKKNAFFFQEEWLRNLSLMRDFRKTRRNKPLVRDIVRKMALVNALKNQLELFNRKMESYCFTNIIESKYRDFQKKLTMKENNSNESFNVITLKSGIKFIDGILKPRLEYLHQLRPDAATVGSSGLKQYNIDELDNLHNDYLDSILDNKLLDAHNGKQPGKFTNQYFPVSLIMLMNQMLELVLSYAELNGILHEILIQLNLQRQDGLNDILARFNLVMKNIVSCFKTFQNNSFALIKDLKLDGNEDMAKLSRILR
ncbi:FAGR338Cp [Eremothecium gossypii FDAG1]|nr:FAGR338Cp [Eremothecium gossypii FDAG1]